ncbi:MAG: MBL fold metallo-hydrolase [Proteobacteria bacterium]|nr:MBL fold metallo-hydrolase [Pseudomonadota bacterium]
MLLFLLACSSPTDALIDRELAAMNDTSLLSDGDLHVVFGGTGTLSTDDRAGSSVAILAADRVLLFDTGPGSTRVLGQSGVPLQHVDTVFLTHFHSDHYGDLGQLTIASEVLGRDHALTVVGPDGVEDVVAGFEQAYRIDHDHRAAQHPGHLEAPSTTVRQVDDGVVFNEDGLVVRAFRVDHEPVEDAWGYRVEDAGKVVVISGDTRTSDAVVENAEGADLLIHEAMDKALAEQVARRADERTGALIRDALVNHSSAADAARVAQLAGADQLAPTHISPPLVAPPSAGAS